MKKVLLSISSVMLAAMLFLSGCDRNTDEGNGNNNSGNSGSGDGGGGDVLGNYGKFVSDRISASYKYASDFFEYDESEGVCVHYVVFSNDHILELDSLTTGLEEGERREMFIVLSYTNDLRLMSCEMPYVGREGINKLPVYEGVWVMCLEGTSDPQKPEYVYEYMIEDGKDSDSVLKIVFDGDGHVFEFNDISMIRKEGNAPESIVGSFSYNGYLSYIQTQLGS